MWHISRHHIRCQDVTLCRTRGSGGRSYICRIDWGIVSISHSCGICIWNIPIPAIWMRMVMMVMIPIGNIYRIVIEYRLAHDLLLEPKRYSYDPIVYPVSAIVCYLFRFLRSEERRVGKEG